MCLMGGMGMGAKSISGHLFQSLTRLLSRISGVLFRSALMWVCSMSLVYGETKLEAPDNALFRSLESIGFDRVSIDNCILEASRPAPEGSSITKFVFNVNLSYLDFTTFEVLQGSAGGQDVFSGRVRFSSAFQREEKTRFEFYRYVRETYGINYVSDAPPPVTDEVAQLIESDLGSAKIEKSTFYRLYVGNISQTVPYVNDFSFTFPDRSIVETVIYGMEALAEDLGCNE